MKITLDYDRGVPVYRQIAEAVLRALAMGELTGSEQLPTIHQLAARLEVNPNTVARSYRELERDGHIISRRGRGSFPAPNRPPQDRDDETILGEIYERAIAEGARQGLSVRDIKNYFRKAKK